MFSRKLKYGCPTVTVTFRCPENRVEDFKSKCYAFLDGLLVSKVQVIEYVDLSVSELDKVSEKMIKFTGTETIIDTKKNECIIKNGILPTEEFLADDSEVYKTTDKIPFGTSPVEIIGQKLHKNNSEEIWYIKLGIGKVVVLYSEKEVKNYIRKELIK